VTDDFRILLVSDVHASAGTDASGVDGAAAPPRLLSDIRSAEPFDLVVVCGDLTDDGAESSSAAVRDIVDEYADSLGAARVFLPGNDDSRTTFRRVFGAGHFGPRGDTAATQVHDGDECAAASVHDGLRVVTLDSSVTGAMFGRVSGAQLTWLTEVLREGAPRGTVVALHHPPPTLTQSPFLSRVALRNSGELEDALAGTDVRGILCGHFHTPMAGSLGAMPVWVAPGVANQLDMTAPADVLRFVSGAGASVVTVAADGRPTCEVLHSMIGPRSRVLKEVAVTPELLARYEISGEPAT
jgi:3',5'-cyclic AMP phosphodiesterase CpdA